jgi:mRNA-degrading endonuclease RelE of RelBE toxin-antitoxin system
MAPPWTRRLSAAALVTCSLTPALRDRPGRPVEARCAPRAQRQLTRLPEKIAAAAAEFITGPLLDNPHRVGHPLRDEYAGQHSARRGPDWRVRGAGSLPLLGAPGIC